MATTKIYGRALNLAKLMAGIDRVVMDVMNHISRRLTKKLKLKGSLDELISLGA